MLLREAKATVSQADRAVRMAQRAARGEIGQLFVGCAVWIDLCPRIIRMFGKRHPDVEVELHNLTAPEQVAALENGRIHIGILRPPVPSKALETQRLLSEHLVVAFSQGHRFAAYERVPWRLLANESYVLTSRHKAPAFNAIVEQACRAAGLTLNVRYEVDHPHTVLILVEAGLGVTLAPSSLETLKRPGILLRRLQPAGPVLESLIAWRRDNTSPLIQPFLRVAREIARAGGRR